MLLEIYLQKNGRKIEDVIGQIDYSQAQLNNMRVILYPNEVFEVIGKVVEKNVSKVLFDLLTLEDSNQITEITSPEKLAEALKNRQPYIYISEPIRTENRRLVNSVQSEKDTLGVELGSRGVVNILAEGIYQLQKLFNKESKEFKELKSKLRHYQVKIHDQRGSILYEKEETY